MRGVTVVAEVTLTPGSGALDRLRGDAMSERIRERIAIALSEALSLTGHAITDTSWRIDRAVYRIGSAIGDAGTAVLDEYARRVESRDAARARAEARAKGWHE